MSNPFYDEEEVDDDAFLSHPKSGRSGYMLPQNNASSRQQGGSSSSAAVEESRRQLMLKKQDIERRTLESSGRSLGYLYESEQVGVATAEELARQKEQLKNTESRLDEINSTLNRSERHLTGIKSVFGGLKNYLSGRSSASSQQQQLKGPTPGAAGKAMPDSVTSGRRVDEDSRLDMMRQANHPGLRSQQRDDGAASVDDILDKNLDEMSLGLTRLKGLAVNLNQELEEHNEIIDRLDHKTSSTQFRVEKQNKDMNNILGKKK